jgi:hypothetical protein
MSDTPAPLSRPFREPEPVDAPRRWPLALKVGIVGVAVAVAAGVLVVRWFDDTSARDQVQLLQTLPQSEAAKTATTAAVAYPFGKDGPSSPEATPPIEPARPAAAAKPAARSVPPGISAQQWHTLVAELSAKPDGAREIARLDQYFRFADTVRQFRDLNRTAASSEPTPALVALARQIDAELDTHIAQRELSGSEAYDIKATLLEVLEPDAEAADEKLERWTRTLPRARTDDDRAAMQRDAEFERRRAALVQAWSAQPQTLRDPKALERDIQNLRQQIYGNNAR